MCSEIGASRIDFDYRATRILAFTYRINFFKYKKYIKSLKDFLTALLNLIKKVNFETSSIFLFNLSV
jgi:hypothetical protein